MIGDAIAAALPELQAEAESLMTATCRIERRTGSQFDPVQNTDTATYSTVYEGVCRVRADTSGAAEVLAGEQQVTAQAYRCLVPINAPEIRPHDRVTVTASDDPRQLAKAFSVTTVATSSEPFCRRFRAIDDQG